MAELVAFLKGFAALARVIDRFQVAWIGYDIKQIGDEVASKKEEYDLLEEKFLRATSDNEQRILMRSLARLR